MVKQDSDADLLDYWLRREPDGPMTPFLAACANVVPYFAEVVPIVEEPLKDDRFPVQVPRVAEGPEGRPLVAPVRLYAPIVFEYEVEEPCIAYFRDF